MTDQPNTERCNGSGWINRQYLDGPFRCPGCDHPDCPNRLEPDPPEQERCPLCKAPPNLAITALYRKRLDGSGKFDPIDCPDPFHSPQEGDEGEAEISEWKEMFNRCEDALTRLATLQERVREVRDYAEAQSNPRTCPWTAAYNLAGDLADRLTQALEEEGS